LIDNPSYQDFATHDDSAYPDLWDGCVFAAAPCLGPSGLRLHDNSGRQNWGTLTNMDAGTDWVVDDGKYAIDFDGINDSVKCGSINTRVISVAAWVYRVSGAVSPVFVSKRSNTEYSWELGCNATNGQALFRVNDNGNNASGGLVPVGAWTHVCGTYDRDVIRVFVNGVLAAQSFAYTAEITQSSVGIAIGARSNFSGAEAYSAILMDDVRVYDRVLARNENRLLAASRGIAYTPRRRLKACSVAGPSFNAAWARGSNQFIQPSLIGVA